MPAKLEDQVGKQYSNLLITKDFVISEVNKKSRKRRVLAKCLLCGSEEEKEYQLSHLVGIKIQSCGCKLKNMLKDRNTTHGLSNTRQYTIWQSIKDRCLNDRSLNYQNYGGRGISVCEKWLTFEGFWEDMQEGYSDELEIDRIDVNGNYCKENCRWTTNFENCFNIRKRKDNTSGRTGVFYDKSKIKWLAYISNKGEFIRLGVFDTFEEAVKAREKAELETYGYTKE